MKHVFVTSIETFFLYFKKKSKCGLQCGLCESNEVLLGLYMHSYRDGLEDNHAGIKLFSSGPWNCDSYPQCLFQQVSA